MTAYAGDWYTGGTLHNKTAMEWHQATYRNRLATSADFITATTPKEKQRLLFNDDMRLLRQRAEALEACITESTQDPETRIMKVSEVGAACLVLLGY